jgi:hypothetical protein
MEKSVKECFKNANSLSFQCHASNANFLLDAMQKLMQLLNAMQLSKNKQN